MSDIDPLPSPEEVPPPPDPKAEAITILVSKANALNSATLDCYNAQQVFSAAEQQREETRSALRRAADEYGDALRALSSAYGVSPDVLARNDPDAVVAKVSAEALRDYLRQGLGLRAKGSELPVVLPT